jgi:hypothetical protein
VDFSHTGTGSTSPFRCECRDHVVRATWERHPHHMGRARGEAGLGRGRGRGQEAAARWRSSRAFL